MRVVDMLERDAALYASKPAVVVDDVVTTYGELHARTRGLAAGLRARGVQRGDRVVVAADNGLLFFDAYLATAYLGAAAVPIGTRLATPEVSYIVENARPRLALADGAHAPALREACPDVSVVDAESADYKEMLNHPDDPDVASEVTENDTALIIYTSGTTGRPKGACLSQRALAFNAFTVAIAQRMTHDDVFLSITPLYHAAAGTRVYSMLVDGQTHVVLRDFDAAAALATIARWQVTMTLAVPVQLRRMLDTAGGQTEDLRSLRLLVYGAAPTEISLLERAMDELPCGLYQGYGLSEAVTNLTALLPEDHDAARSRPELLASCGRPVPGVQIELRDERGDVVPIGAVGEIYVRSEKVMTGYWDDPAQTEQALVDGWLNTGDLASADEDGYMYLAGRAKDMLISGGVNVYPSEIERVLAAHPDVIEASVVGVPDAEWGEVPVAFVITAPGATLDPAALVAHCSESLSRIKVPRHFEFVDELPRTATGKVRKVDLRPLAEGILDKDRADC